MKCIRCSNDSKYSERTSGTCPKCNGRFAFEPKTGDIFTDPAFAAAIDRVSAQGAVRFTAANLYYELARTKRNRIGGKIAGIVGGIIVAIVGSIIAASAESIIVFFVAITIGAVLVVLGVRSKPTPTVAFSRGVFDSMLEKWKRAHGAPAKLVQRAAEPAGGSKKALPRELATYSFDRAVICDHAETVDLLLANNFHFENNCAILSVDKYPPAVFGPVLEMLRRNPRIEVFALHDASIDGHALAHLLATHPDWFRGIGRVTDVGILVRHAEKMRGMWQETFTGRSPAFKDLSSAENAWLARYTLELAAIRPEQIVKRLFRAMTQPGTQVTNDDGTFFFVGGSFGSTDAGTSDGGGDSFG